MPTEAQIISSLERKRQNCFEGLKRIERYVKGITDTTNYEEIMVRLELMEKYYVQFSEYEDALANYNVDSQATKFEENYLQLKVQLRTEAASRNLVSKEVESQVVAAVGRILEHKKSVLDTTLDKSFNTTQELRLPRLDIPKFGGSYRDFPSFRDLYEAAVHNNDNLPVCYKFHYLKGVLIDDAAELIKHMQLTDANYQLAWKKIVERYDKKRHIIAELIQSCLQQPASTTRDGTLRKLCDKTDEVLRGLKALGRGAETRDPWLIQLLLPKVHNDIRHRWAIKTVDTEFPSIDEFLKFLNEQCDALETCQAEGNSITNLTNQQPNNRQQVKAHNLIENKIACLKCDGDHPLYQCNEFQNLSRDAKYELLKRKGACFNCLSRSHIKTQCLSKSTCRVCHQQHHTLLHDSYNKSNNPSSVNLNLETSEHDSHTTTTESTVVAQLEINHNYSKNVTLLPTAQVIVENEFGEKLKARILLDSGSQASFIHEALVDKLKLKLTHARIQVSGIATNNIVTRGVVDFTLRSRAIGNTVRLPIHAYVLKQMVTIPVQSMDKKVNDWDKLSNIFLADPDFQKADNIDILIGADYFFTMISSGHEKLSNGLTMVDSVFGWILTGTLVDCDIQKVNNFHLTCDLDATLKRFWETESIPVTQQLTDTEKLAMDHFNTTCKLHEDGRYMVSLPFRNDIELGTDCYDIAHKRFLAIERKFRSNEKLRTEYFQFMQEYIDLGHMELAKGDDDCTRAGVTQYFLPHHAVFKDDGGKQKIRVVFDGSVKASNTGASLNDALLIGPTVQPTLWSTLVRFRKHAVPLVADIEKMYRQIWLNPSDRKFHKILWRHSTSDPIVIYNLKTVTYGTSCAPYLAIASLRKLGESIRETNQLASTVILRDFYVDDLISGADSISEAISLKTDIQHALKTHGFNLRKIASSYPEIIEDDETGRIGIVLEDQQNLRKILGVTWKPHTDSFSFNVKITEHGALTKRSFISQSAQIFDPFGFLAPVTVMAKILFQRLWTMKVDWDDVIPHEIGNTWTKIKVELIQMTKVSISRHISVGTSKIKEIQLHGFSDASEDAYAAVVYSRVVNEDDVVTVRLLASKTRVAPLNQVSLPRLELCGALLLSQLMSQVVDSFKDRNVDQFAWTDSTIVLAWLSEFPRKWKAYIANRTSSILEIIPAHQWRHVISRDNPADHATRGLFPSELLETEQWWNGPAWLSLDKSQWPHAEMDEALITEVEKEARRVKISLAVNIEEDHVLTILTSRISSWNKLLRILAFIHRWLPNNPYKGPIKVIEINRAENVIIRHVQQLTFGPEIQGLRQKRTISMKSKIISLSPILDENGVLRVGGRLQNSPLGYTQKHPIIIPKSCSVSRLIVGYYHHLHLHAGPSLLSYLVRHKYWIIGIKSVVRDMSRRCVVCVRHKYSNPNQLMGNLPEVRVNAARPFSKVAVDYAGPISLLSKRGRGAKTMKGYICIFVDMVVKAVHLEAVSDLTTEAFIMALKRFIGRRGLPTYIRSDNGSNFIGAARQLKEVYQLIQSKQHNDAVSDYLTKFRVQWEFSPPASPHFNGLVEAAVKSVKYHLNRVLQETRLIFEEMSTFLCQVEGILNSRPLYASTDDDSNDVLTPGHFLIMGEMTALPETTLDDHCVPTAKRWKQVQARVNGFWKRFYNEYLTTLQQRHKWSTITPNLSIGDLVLLKEDNVQPGKWPRGRVVDLHRGNDDLVRVVTIRTSNSTLKRAVHKLVKLHIQE